MPCSPSPSPLSQVRLFGESSLVRQGKPLSRMLIEYLGGGDLFGLMRTIGLKCDKSSNRLGFAHDAARFYCACVASGLDVMHATGWMHRDIKLENVVVDNHGVRRLP
jgi:serine/threonine protein kinase